MSNPNSGDHGNRLFLLSDQLFGKAEEVSLAEAEAACRAACVEPEEVLSFVLERLAAKAQTYQDTNRPVPDLLERAIEELGSSRSETSLFREARAAVSRVLGQVKQLGARLPGEVTLTFAAAYRKKKGLSERDKQLLDGVVEGLRKRAAKGGQRS